MKKVLAVIISIFTLSACLPENTIDSVLIGDWTVDPSSDDDAIFMYEKVFDTDAEPLTCTYVYTFFSNGYLREAVSTSAGESYSAFNTFSLDEDQVELTINTANSADASVADKFVYTIISKDSSKVLLSIEDENIILKRKL